MPSPSYLAVVLLPFQLNNDNFNKFIWHRTHLNPLKNANLSSKSQIQVFRPNDQKSIWPILAAILNYTRAEWEAGTRNWTLGPRLFHINIHISISSGIKSHSQWIRRNGNLKEETSCTCCASVTRASRTQFLHYLDLFLWSTYLIILFNLLKFCFINSTFQ